MYMQDAKKERIKLLGRKVRGRRQARRKAGSPGTPAPRATAMPARATPLPRPSQSCQRCRLPLQGFIRIAIEMGIDGIVPVYHFGNSQTLDFGPASLQVGWLAAVAAHDPGRPGGCGPAAPARPQRTHLPAP
jgi:hypothetical protein